MIACFWLRGLQQTNTTVQVGGPLSQASALGHAGCSSLFSRDCSLQSTDAEVSSVITQRSSTSCTNLALSRPSPHRATRASPVAQVNSGRRPTSQPILAHCRWSQAKMTLQTFQAHISRQRLAISCCSAQSSTPAAGTPSPAAPRTAREAATHADPQANPCVGALSTNV